MRCYLARKLCKTFEFEATNIPSSPPVTLKLDCTVFAAGVIGCCLVFQTEDEAYAAGYTFLTPVEIDSNDRFLGLSLE